MAVENKPIDYRPIGTFYSSRQYKAEAPRQGVLAEGQGEIRLLAGQNYEQALDDLQGFERLWIIYDFHLNSNWKPKTAPPVSGGQKKVGVFASRSPYRPNSLGLSCVRLEQIAGLVVRVSECDLLHKTPVLDIKPYLPYADAFPQAKVGWPAQQSVDSYSIDITNQAAERIRFIEKQAGLDMQAFIATQLAFGPAETKKKRITVLDAAAGLFQIAFRTWRIVYTVDAERRIITVERITSGYSNAELQADDDPYHDKQAHRLFENEFEAN